MKNEGRQKVLERKDSDERLSDQQRVLEKILEAPPVGICLVENRIFKWVNAERVKMFGYEKKEDDSLFKARIIPTISHQETRLKAPL